MSSVCRNRVIRRIRIGVCVITILMACLQKIKRNIENVRMAQYFEKEQLRAQLPARNVGRSDVAFYVCVVLSFVNCSEISLILTRLIVF